MASQKPVNNEMLKGTLDMMVLRTLIHGDAHGHTIAKVIEQSSEDVLDVEQGSLYPALHRLQNRGWVSSYWGVSENNRKAKVLRVDCRWPETAEIGDQPVAENGSCDCAGDG